MTEIREGAFSMELPDGWRPAESDEPGTSVYRGTVGGELVSVTLLAVAPVYAMADSRVLLEQYLHHRPRWEQGQDARLLQSEPILHDEDGLLEGAWIAEDPDTGRRLAHRVILEGTLLADVCYEAYGLDTEAFADRAAELLGAVEVTAG